MTKATQPPCSLVAIPLPACPITTRMSADWGVYNKTSAMQVRFPGFFPPITKCFAMPAVQCQTQNHLFYERRSFLQALKELSLSIGPFPSRARPLGRPSRKSESAAIAKELDITTDREAGSHPRRRMPTSCRHSLHATGLSARPAGWQGFRLEIVPLLQLLCSLHREGQVPTADLDNPNDGYVRCTTTAGAFFRNRAMTFVLGKSVDRNRVSTVDSRWVEPIERNPWRGQEWN